MPASLSLRTAASRWLGRGGARLGQPPHLGVQGAHREAAVHGRPPGGGRQVPEIAQDQGGLGEDAEGVARLAQRLDDPPGEVVLALGVLVGVGVGPHGHVVAGPGPGAQLGPHPLDRVHLDHDPALEVLAGPKAQVVVGGPGEAVGAGVAAAAVGVDGVAEGHPAGLGHPVDHRARLDVEELHPGVLARAHVAAGGRLVGEEGGGVLLLGRAPAEAGGRAGGHDRHHSEQVFDNNRPAVPRTATPAALALTHCGDGAVVTTKGSASSRSPARTPQRGRKGPPRHRAAEAEPGLLADHAADLWAIGLVTVGVLLALALYGGAAGWVGRGVDNLLGSAIGWTRYLLPPLAIAAGVLIIAGRHRPEPVRTVVGAVLGLCALAGLCELAGGSPDAGGHDRGAAVGRRLPRGPGGPPPRARAGQRRRGGGARGRGGGGGGALDRGLPGHARTGGGRRRHHGRARRPAVVGRGDHPGGDAARAGRRAALARRRRQQHPPNPSPSLPPSTTTTSTSPRRWKNRRPPARRPSSRPAPAPPPRPGRGCCRRPSSSRTPRRSGSTSASSTRPASTSSTPWPPTGCRPACSAGPSDPPSPASSSSWGRG